MTKRNIYYISGLGAIRGASACLIVYFHVWALCGFSGFSTILDKIIGNFDSLVRMFFLLSAVALLCGYERKMDSEKNIINFYIKRFFKIAPVFYMVLIVQMFIDYFFMGEKYSIYNIIISISLLFGLLPANQEPIVWASWAVGIEWIFYLLFPVFVLIIKNKRALVVGLVSSLIITYNYEKIVGSGIVNPHINILIYFSYFFMGAILYKGIPWIRKIKKCRSWILIQYIYIICAISLGVLLGKYLNRDIGMLVTFSLILGGSIYGYTGVFENKFMDWLGRISYAVYLLHMIVVQVFSRIGIIQTISRTIQNKYISYFITSTIVLLVTCVAAHFTTKYVEEYWVNKARKYVI